MYSGTHPQNSGYATVTKYSAVKGGGTFGVNGKGEGSINNTAPWTAAVPYALFDSTVQSGAGTDAHLQNGDCEKGIYARYGSIPEGPDKKQLCYKLESVSGVSGTTNVQVYETCGGNCAYKSGVYPPGVVPDCPTLSGGGGLTPWTGFPPIKSAEMVPNQWGQNQYSHEFRCPAAQLDANTRKNINATSEKLPSNIANTGTSTQCSGQPDWCGGNFMHFDIDKTNTKFFNGAGTGLVKYTRIDCKSGDPL
jgi:hypothetical protein